MRRLALAFAILAAWPATASAVEPFEMVDRARMFWEQRGATVPCDRIEIRWNLAEQPRFAGSAPIRPWTLPINFMADNGHCWIELSHWWWKILPRRYRCTLVIHELGHLIGLHHEPDPRHVMYWRLERPHPTRLCRWRTT